MTSMDICRRVGLSAKEQSFFLTFVELKILKKSPRRQPYIFFLSMRGPSHHDLFNYNNGS